MKKTYIQPAALVVSLGTRRNMMLTGSVTDGPDGGERILGNGGEGTGGDIGVKGTSDVNLWDKEW